MVQKYHWGVLTKKVMNQSTRKSQVGLEPTTVD